MSYNLLNPSELAQFYLGTAQYLSQQNDIILELARKQNEVIASLISSRDHMHARISVAEALVDAKFKVNDDFFADLIRRIDAIEQSCHRLRAEVEGALYRLDQIERSWPREFRVITPANQFK